jgi:hypothetical protein
MTLRFGTSGIVEAQRMNPARAQGKRAAVELFERVARLVRR